jgi:multifunctional methyltransferase subunit TRM112
MRLLSHNSLRCTRKDVITGFPLKIHAEHVEVCESPCNREFIAQLAPNLHWPALTIAAREVGIDALPETLDLTLLQDPAFIDALHHVLMDVHVLEGKLECPESGQIFPINNGVTNMVLDEDLLP